MKAKRWVVRTADGRYRGLRDDGPLHGAFLWNKRIEAFEVLEQEGDEVVGVEVTVRLVPKGRKR